MQTAGLKYTREDGSQGTGESKMKTTGLWPMICEQHQSTRLKAKYLTCHALVV